MSYTNFHARLEAAREAIWAELESARDELESPEIDADSAKELHSVHVKRLFAMYGLRSVVEAMAKIDRSLKRDKSVIGSDAQVAAAYEGIVSFAESVADKEIQTVREANEAYANAAN